MPKFGDPEFDPVEMARRSHEVRRAKTNIKSLADLRAAGDHLLQALVDAAEGKGDWKELSVDKRFAALKLVLEYSFGRPRAMSHDEGKDATEDEGDDTLPIG